MNTVIDIADSFLKHAKANGNELTPMQLLKLCYIAHGWNLAINDKPLFPQTIEAWQYGPVIPYLYSKIKDYGKAPIPLAHIDDNPADVDDATNAFIGEVYERYQIYSGLDLSGMTHQAGTPWYQVYTERHNCRIPDNAIKDYYRAKLNNNG